AVAIAGCSASNGNRRRDMRVRVVIFDDEIVGLVAEKTLAAVLDHQLRQRTRLASELQSRLLEVVRVEMAIATRPDESPRRETALARQHVRQKRVRGDVERHAEEQVGAARI